ncbi:MAG: carotenoid 1,2-hydratase [Bryobacteraceae bacterium]|nr:hypothetical protein [Bryobacterales bacterium]MEB2362536.1 hypothetical protein [Bryobacterales bacterium]NUN01453.1 carotenoid 1,2-hydratase [Bryobacteraceae bacterium]
MKSSRVLALLLLALISQGAGSDWRVALPGYRYSFPRDYFSHPEFRTEWWYYTGNLQTQSGRCFGFELTFFRHAAGFTEPESVWDVRDVWLAHLALSDIDGGRFFHVERINRSGPGIAGASLKTARVWNGNWQVRWVLDAARPAAFTRQSLEAVSEQFRVHLSLESKKPPVVHGKDGVSQKAEGRGRASHYISLTRLEASGSIAIGGEEFKVEGLAWMDHEFFTHQLAPGQTGWDWLSLQLEDGTDLMLFRLRREDGSIGPYSAGTFVDAVGKTKHLALSRLSLVPEGDVWRSQKTGARYPVAWSISIPELGLAARVRTRLPQQELTSRHSGVGAYWEGAVEITGTRNGRPLHGRGYLEMTGYAAPVKLRAD